MIWKLTVNLVVNGLDWSGPIVSYHRSRNAACMAADAWVVNEMIVEEDDSPFGDVGALVTVDTCVEKIRRVKWTDVALLCESEIGRWIDRMTA